MIVTSDVVSLEKRGFYQGMLCGVVTLTNSMGLLIGGAFSEKVSWRWCFYINVPLTRYAILVVAFVILFKKVTGDIRGRLAKIDYMGCFFMFTSAILILLALSWGGTAYEWNPAGSVAPLVIRTVLIVAFIIMEIKYAKLPLIPSESLQPFDTVVLVSSHICNIFFFKIKTVAGAHIGAFLTGLCSAVTCFMYVCPYTEILLHFLYRR
jgi:hypothetical protein